MKRLTLLTGLVCLMITTPACTRAQVAEWIALHPEPSPAKVEAAPAPEVHTYTDDAGRTTTITLSDECKTAEFTGSGFEVGVQVQLRFGEQPPIGQVTDSAGKYGFTMHRLDGTGLTSAGAFEPSSGYDFDLTVDC